jgi:hypothetical protein
MITKCVQTRIPTHTAPSTCLSLSFAPLHLFPQGRHPPSQVSSFWIPTTISQRGPLQSACKHNNQSILIVIQDARPICHSGCSCSISILVAYLIVMFYLLWAKPHARTPTVLVHLRKVLNNDAPESPACCSGTRLWSLLGAVETAALIFFLASTKRRLDPGSLWTSLPTFPSRRLDGRGF